MDVQLKSVCERFIADMSVSLTAPLKDLLAKCDVIFQLAEKDRLDPANTLHQQPFAKPGVLSNSMKHFLWRIHLWFLPCTLLSVLNTWYE